MSAPPPPEGGPKKSRKKLFILVAAVVLLGGGGAGAWFSGLLPGLLGKGGGEAAASAEHEPKPAGGHGAKSEPSKAAEGHGAKPAAGGHGKPAETVKADSSSPFVDLPDIVANLNGGPRRNVFVKVKAKLELARAEDQGVVQAAMPRVLDLFQSYLREMRPEEMRGSASTYRLREELLSRTNLVVPQARVIAVLFTEVLVQ